MNLALRDTKTTVVRTYEVLLYGKSIPYRKATKLEIRLTTINNEYACYTIDDPNHQATAIELLEIGAEVLRILKEDEASPVFTPLVNVINPGTISPTTTAEDCPF